MKNEILNLERVAFEIRTELDSIKKLKEEYLKFEKKYTLMDEFLIRSKATFFADFYMGIEKIFRIIAQELNGGLPQGDDWHKRLLFDMSIKIGSRQIVISKTLYVNLNKFLGFRHVVRHSYGFDIDERKLNDLAVLFIPTIDTFISEIEFFLQKLISNG